MVNKNKPLKILKHGQVIFTDRKISLITGFIVKGTHRQFIKYITNSYKFKEKLNR